MLTGMVCIYYEEKGKTRVRQGGVDHGVNPIVLSDRTIEGIGRVVAVKWPGGSYWSGIGQTSYRATTFIVFTVDKHDICDRILSEFNAR